MANLINFILIPFIMMLLGLVGYFFGVIVAMVPLINDLFTVGLGLKAGAIPTILAWVLVSAYSFSVFNSVMAGGDSK